MARRSRSGVADSWLAALEREKRGDALLRVVNLKASSAKFQSGRELWLLKFSDERYSDFQPSY